MILLIHFISLLISLPGFINKSGEKLVYGFIPFYNIYLFFKILEFNPIILFLIGLGMAVFSIEGIFFVTLLLISLPFIVSYSYGKGFKTAILCLFLPFIIYPYLAYFGGFYENNYTPVKFRFFSKHIFSTIFIIIFSIHIYGNYTRIIEGNKLIDKNSKYYINDLYMSDGRIYNNYLSKDEQLMYDYLMESILKFETGGPLELNKYGCLDSSECVNKMLLSVKAIWFDHPELMSFSSISGVYGEDYFKLRIEYAKQNKLVLYFGEKKIERIIDDIKKETKNMSDREKIKYVYDWIGKNSKYDYVFTDNSKNQSIYNVFLKHNAVCAGFAKASQVIFQNIGIQSYLVGGNTEGPHMWNIVKVDGKYYFYDSTVSACIEIESKHHYDGLIQTEMNKTYFMDNPEWYPKIEDTDFGYNK